MIKAGAKVTIKVIDMDVFNRKIKPCLGVSIDNSKFVDIARIVKTVYHYEQHLHDLEKHKIVEYVKK